MGMTLMVRRFKHKIMCILIEIYALITIIFINLLGEEMYMVDMYVALVIAGRRTCNEDNKTVPLVPKKWREAVLADLEALGLDGDGNII